MGGIFRWWRQLLDFLYTRHARLLPRCCGAHMRPTHKQGRGHRKPISVCECPSMRMPLYANAPLCECPSMRMPLYANAMPALPSCKGTCRGRTPQGCGWAWAFGPGGSPPVPSQASSPNPMPTQWWPERVPLRPARCPSTCAHQPRRSGMRFLPLDPAATECLVGWGIRRIP
jgi:hypothetical protein